MQSVVVPDIRKAPTMTAPKPTSAPRHRPTAPASAIPPSLVYATVSTPLGCLLVAATGDGIRAVEFGASAVAFAAALERRHPTAIVVQDAAAVRPAVDALLRHLDGRQPRLDLPFDVAGTPFEERVWAALREIPYGATRSYGEVARAIGEPTAAREVGEACAANPIALLVPCHRVVRRDGTPGGYRWGAWRKRALLAREARATAGEAGGSGPSQAPAPPPIAINPA
jgi:AraC family transcriptional regulator of adaptative response/methylated-DNA-[protein]-cysteine methyltransferase